MAVKVNPQTGGPIHDMPQNVEAPLDKMKRSSAKKAQLPETPGGKPVPVAAPKPAVKK